MNRLKNLVRLIFVSLLLISVLYVNSSAQTYPKNVQVVVKKGVDKDYNRLIEQNASVILTQINQQSPQVFDLPQSIKDDEGSYGLKELKELLINTGIKVSKDIFETDILIISIPPKRSDEIETIYPLQISTVLPLIEEYKIKKVIFINNEYVIYKF